MPKAAFFHYSDLESWSGVESGSWGSGDTPCLAASRRVRRLTTGRGRRFRGGGAVFGLTEPEPQSWKDNSEYPRAWERLMNDTGNLLLRYTLTAEEIEGSYIIDWSHFEKAYGYKADAPELDTSDPETYNKRLFKAEQRYVRSRIPLAKYIEKPKHIEKISLPEVITMQSIPFERVEIHEYQPKLENLHPTEMSILERAIRNNPSLEVLDQYTNRTVPGPKKANANGYFSTAQSTIKHILEDVTEIPFVLAEL